jgi:F-type H+-transporting ATPase subunit delta
MIEGRLSRRYAKAIFALAREEHGEENFAGELDRFVEAYNTSPLNTVLTNPAFGVQTRKNVAVEVAQALDLSPLVVRFLAFLTERDRLAYLPSIALHYHRLLDEAKGRVEARVVSPSPLGDGMMENVNRVLKGICGKEVILKEETRTDLIGGLLIELEGKVYDGSILTQLERMKESIERG